MGFESRIVKLQMKKDRGIAFLLFGGIFLLSLLSMSSVAGLFSQPIPTEAIVDVDSRFRDNLERIESMTGRLGIIGNFFRLEVTSEVGVSGDANLYLQLNNTSFYAPVHIDNSNTDKLECPVVGKLIRIRDLQNWWSKLVDVDIPNCMSSYGKKNDIDFIGEKSISSGITLQLDGFSKLLLFILGIFFWGSILIFLTRVYKSCLELIFHLSDSNS